MDNFHIDVICIGRDNLKAALTIVSSQHRQAVGYSVSPEKGLIFYWAEHDKMTALPFKLDVEGMTDFATRWLAEQAYGREPDHDGDNDKGWRVYNEAWGKIGSDWQTFIAVRPAWACYGK